MRETSKPNGGIRSNVRASKLPWAPATVFLLGFVYLLFAIFGPLKAFDEGLVVCGAERILSGAIPYRDFAAYYTPGQFYTLAAIFRVFGASILVERAWDTLVRFSVCIVVFLIARTFTRGKTAYLPFFVTLLFFGWCGFFGYPVIPAMLLALVAILLLVRSYPENGRWSLLLAGFSAGLSVIYRQDVGAYAFASGAVALLVAGSAMRLNSGSEKGYGWERLKALLWYGLGACVVAVPVLVFFLTKASPGQLWADFWKLPRFQLQFRRLPLPPIIPDGAYLLASQTLMQVWFLFYVPVAIYAATFFRMLRKRLRSAGEAGVRRERFAEMLLVSFGLLLYVTAVTRADAIHCLALTIPAAILLVPLLRDWPWQRVWGGVSLALCALVLTMPYVVSPAFLWAFTIDSYPPWRQTSSLARARLFHVPADQEEAVRFIQRQVPQGQPIFVGNAQHRQVFGNDILFYFLAERPPGTRYEEFEPGVVTTSTVQREMVRELQYDGVRWVVLFSGFESDAKRMPSVGAGASILDDFLRREYRRVETFGRYTICEKREIQGRS